MPYGQGVGENKVSQEARALLWLLPEGIGEAGQQALGHQDCPRLSVT